MDVGSTVFLVVAHPGHAGLEDFGLAAHVELVAADEGDQLALRQVEKLLLDRYLERKKISSINFFPQTRITRTSFLGQANDLNKKGLKCIL